MRPRYILFVLGIGLLFAGVAIGSSVQSGFGTVTVTEVDFTTRFGANIHSTLQKPVYATDSDPLPGVVVIHGVQQSKEWLMAFGIELARRGFVVLTIDAGGHGNSDVGNESGIAAVEYLAGLNYVDNSSIGVIGHSMGSGIGWRAIQYASVTPKAFVVVGGWTANTTLPLDILVTVGSFDSFFSGSDPQDIADAFGVPSVESGVTYGSFTNGTARRFVITPTNHLFETIDPTIVVEAVEWMKDSLKGGVEDEHWIPSNSLIFSFWLVGGLIALVGLLLTIFPLIGLLLDQPVFSSLKGVPSEYAASNRTFWGLGLLYGAIGLGTFFPFLLVGGIIGSVIPFPQDLGVSVMTWMIGSGLLALLIAIIIIRRRWEGSVSLRTLLKTNGKFLNGFIKTLVLALIVFVWLYAWTLVVDLGFALDFRCFLPGFNDLILSELVILPVYFIGFLIYFLIESVWFMGLMLPGASDSIPRTEFKWSMKAITIKTIPYLIMIAIEYGGGLLTGTAVVPGMIGYSWLFFYAFAPWFVVCSAIITVAYRRTGKHWLGAIISAM
ncbi:MAG: alpha/beta fold hydrolase, partial [Candidatus Thorarchaeota archaeon]